MYRFALRGRWLVGHVVVLAIAALFIWLGFWQLHKAEATSERNSTIRSREAMAPVDLSILLAGGKVGGEGLQRRVTMAGRYEPDEQFVVLYRSVGEEPGALVLTPLVMSDGTAIVVNRGWFPSQEAQPSLPPDSAPPLGEVRVTGLLLPGEGKTKTSGPSSTGQPIDLTSIDLAAIRASVPSAVYPFYVQLQQRELPATVGALRPLPPTDLSSGPYFSYAVQWFLFTAVGLVGWPLLIRRASRERAARST